MENTLERLVDRIYLEGVGKAEAKANGIIAAAEKHALDLRENAKGEASAIIQKARDEAGKILQNVQGELKLAASRALSDLKREISTVLAGATVKTPVKAAFSDAEFAQSLISRLMTNSAGESIVIAAGATHIAPLQSLLGDALGNQLQKITLSESSKLKGISITVKGDGYEVQYDESSVLALLEPHLKEATRKLFRSGND